MCMIKKVLGPCSNDNLLSIRSDTWTELWRWQLFKSRLNGVDVDRFNYEY